MPQPTKRTARGMDHQPAGEQSWVAWDAETSACSGGRSVTATRVRLPGRSTPKGARGAPVPAGLAGPKRRPQWVLAGVVLVVGAMIGFGLWSTSLGHRREVLVAARELPAGHVVTDQDLRTVRIGTSDSVAIVSAANRGRILGKTTRMTVPSGGFLSPDEVTAGSAVADGKAVVGVVLAPGAVPAGGVRVGDRVVVISAPTGTSATGESDPASAVATAEVFGVERAAVSSTSAGGVSVALLVDQAEAVDVSAAAGSGRARLVVVPRSGRVEVSRPRTSPTSTPRSPGG